MIKLSYYERMKQYSSEGNVQFGSNYYILVEKWITIHVLAINYN